jgi:hypothetical protein
VAGDFLTASRTASFFLSREGGQGGGASGGAGLPGLLRARLYAEALRDPAAQAGRLVAAASPPEEGRALLTARALAAMVRAATDQGRPVLAEGLLEELFALEDQDDDDLPYVKARAASMLAGLYSRKLMFSELQALYRKADALENFPGVAGEKFRAAARVISAYAAGGELGPALSLYRSLARLEGLEEFDSVRASAAAALSAAFAENGLLPEARGLYAIQGEFLDQDSGAGPVRDVPGADLLGLRAASADLIGHFEREMFRGEEEAEMEEAALADRAKAASCLMDAYSERGETGEALRVYGELRLPHSAELPPAERLLLALRLVNVCLRDGDVERAREIFRREALELPPLDHLQEGRASMAAALITALAARGDLDGARSVYDAVTFPGDGPKARHSRCSLEDTTIRVFAAAGQPARAARILKSPRFREACGSFPLKAARSALELAESFVRTGSLGEARAICESGVIEQGGNDGLTGRAMVTCSAITRLCLDGELETARRLFEELPQASRSRRSALYRVMASMSLREAYAETGNAEGLEFIARCVEGFNSLEAKLYGRRAGARGAAGSGQ